MLNEGQTQGFLSRTDSHGRAVHNDLLTRIPENEFRIIRPSLEFIPIQSQQILQEAGESIEHLVLLSSGLVSLLVVTGDARSVEVGMVGKDGCVGGALVAGARTASQRALVQIAGEGFRIKADAFIDILNQCPEFRSLLHRYILLQCMQVGQLAACNRLHEVDERLARWLLMSHDRAEGNAFPVTHDQLARMLGSGRPSVTVAAGGLQRAGVIEYKRGQVKVVNRQGLEHAACECYDAMRRIHAENPGATELRA